MSEVPGAPCPQAELRLGDKLIALLRDSYPNVTFITHDPVKPERYCARAVPHSRPYISLGVDPTESPPCISLGEDRRAVAEPYVSTKIGVTTEATSAAVVFEVRDCRLNFTLALDERGNEKGAQARRSQR